MKPVIPFLEPRSLPGGLTLRQAAPADTEALADFNARIHGDPGLSPLTRDLMSPAHPACGAECFTLVEHEGRIVSSLCLIPQRWTYAGIPFGVGRPELVGTEPALRRRGLVRTQMEIVHSWSLALGQPVQAITGKRWFYRQFGYEYALDLGGGRFYPFGVIPPLPADCPEPYRLRPLAEADLTFAMRLYDEAGARSQVACPRDIDFWRYELEGRSPGSLACNPYQVIEDAAGEQAGLLMSLAEIFDGALPIHLFLVAPGHSLRAILPPVMRALRPQAEAQGAALGKRVDGLYFNLGRAHPVFDALADLPSRVRPPYAWYLRVPDVPGFLRHVAPALEARLTASALAGHSGELKVTTYTGGFRLSFERGRLAEAQRWPPPAEDEMADAAFPPLVFLQLLFGFRSLTQLRATYPDCLAEGQASLLLEALFPPQQSVVYGIE